MKKVPIIAPVAAALVAVGVYLAARDDGSGMWVPMPEAGTVPADAPPADRAAFAEAMAAAVRASAPGAETEIDEKRYVLRWEKGDLRGEYLLGRSFDEYARLPVAEREAYVKRRASTVMAPPLPATLAEAEPRLVPLVRPRIDYEVARISMAEDPMRDMPPEPPHVALTEDLWGVLAYETEEQFVRLDGKALEKWNAKFDDVWARAVTRLEQRSARVTVTSKNDVYELRAGDGNDTARLLVPSVLAKIAVGGDAVLAAPKPDLLLAADPGSPVGLRALAKRLGEEWDKGGTNLRLLRAHEGTISPFAVEATNPARAELVDLFASTDQHDEELQREALKARFGEKEGTPFVASMKRVRNPETGGEFSFVVHSEQVLTLLPRAEWVAFRRVDLEKKTATTLACGTWDRVFALMKGRWKETPFHPARWLANELPTPKELAQLGCDHPILKMDMNVARRTQ